MKEIKIDILVLLGILLILSSIIIGSIGYVSYTNSKCLLDPVAYANNNSDLYAWDRVVPIIIPDQLDTPIYSLE